MDGWIKLHRKFLTWEWYQDANTLRVFLHLILKANHKDGKWQGVDVQAGQLLTGRLKLAQELNLSERQIRTSLNRLKSTNEVTIKTTKQYSIITLNNWDAYQQNDQQSDQQATNKRPTNDQQTTTNKNDKKYKNDKNEKKDSSVSFFSPPVINDIRQYCTDRNNSVDAESFHDFYQSKNWMVGKNKMTDWKAAVRTWERKDKENNKSYRHISEIGGCF